MNIIQDLLTDTPNISVTIPAEDLMAFAKEIVNQTISSLDKASNEETVWLSIEQVAQRLQVNKATLWRWNRNGYLTHTKFGSKVRYRQCDVERVESSEKKGGCA